MTAVISKSTKSCCITYSNAKVFAASYNEITEDLKPYNVTRLVTIVKNDCKEWMSEQETSAIVVFPPNSLPTSNQQSVQVIIQNGVLVYVPRDKQFGSHIVVSKT